MPYAVENAIYQWQEGERSLLEASEPERAGLERALDVVLDELADLYALGTDWGEDLAAGGARAGQLSAVVAAAFGRSAREARNYAGGRARERHDRP